MAGELADHRARRTPLNILAGTNRSGTGENRDRADVVGDPFSGFSPPSRLAGHPVHHEERIRQSGAGTFGNIGRNAIYGPASAPSISRSSRTPRLREAARRIPRGDFQSVQSD
jgi:hypothetical protein